MTSHGKIKYTEQRYPRKMIIEGDASNLELIIREIANNLNCPIDPAVNKEIENMHSFERGKYKPDKLDCHELNFQTHRVLVDMSKKGILRKKTIQLSYFYNDSGKSEAEKESHFKEIQETFYEVVKTIF